MSAYLKSLKEKKVSNCLPEIQTEIIYKWVGIVLTGVKKNPKNDFRLNIDPSVVNLNGLDEKGKLDRIVEIFNKICRDYPDSIFNAFTKKALSHPEYGYSISLRLREVGPKMTESVKEFIEEIRSRQKSKSYNEKKEKLIESLLDSLYPTLLKKFENTYENWDSSRSDVQPRFSWKFSIETINPDGSFNPMNILILFLNKVCKSERVLNCLKYYIYPKKECDNFFNVSFTLKTDEELGMACPSPEATDETACPSDGATEDEEH
jgi:hypothetical protein